MTPREAILIAKAHLAVEEICTNRDKQLPPELTDRALFVLTIIRDASKYADWKKNSGSLIAYNTLLERELQPLLRNGVITRNEIEQLLPLFEAYQKNEVDSKFGFLHAILNLISRISDVRAQELLKTQQEESLHERAQKNKAVGHRIRPKGYGPYPDDARW